MGLPPGRRAVAVHAQHSGRQGSGVLLTDDTVLTCAHVLEAGYSAWVSVPGVRDRALCRVIWADPQLDAALLQAPESLVSGLVTTLVNGTTARLAAVATERPLPDCEIVGFPRVQRYDEGRRLESDQYTGTVLPLAGLIRRTMILELDRPPAAERAEGGSPLAGLSGAPVFAGSGLLGIVKGIPRGRGHLRVECVPLAAIVAGDGFRGAYAKATGGLPPEPAAQTRHTTADSAHEEEYAEAVGAAYRRTKIFGLDELNRRASEWDLDTAYLSLEAASREPGCAPVPHRVDELLASRPRVLLRGDAGAGKTTLVWWLAAHAAAGTLGPQLAGLNGLVPFVVPLRTLRARGAGFPSPAELPGVAGLMVDPAPDGWAGRVLSAGRALLLVDGLDEVPPDDREAAYAWLSGLLARFPRTRCLATVRPLAVEPEWLAAEGFEELTLLPMRDQDVQAFVTAWHDAAGLDGEDPEALKALEQDLLQQFHHNPTLSDLARTPLLCAVTCALHRLREGFLPESRWALYESALQMLLGARDDRRRIDAPDGIRMSVEEHRQLLQRLAAWLVRGGQTEFTRDQALHQLNRALPGMPRVAGQGTPEEILTHLLNRSGLLQERRDDVFQFAHRTFQDFLAAKEFVEDDLVPELLRHAREQQWHDVLLLAAGHCSRRELPVLVEGLLAAGSASRKWDLKTTLYVLAALCAQHAAWLSEPLHHRVRNAVTSVLPPRNLEQVRQLARLGPYVLPLLPGPHEDGRFDEQVIEVICAVGGAEAVPYARAFVGSHFAHRLAFRWRYFPSADYAREVLARLDLGQDALLVSTRSELAHLRLLSGVGYVTFLGDFTGEELARAVVGLRPDTVGVVSNHVLDSVEWLRDCAGGALRGVTLQNCPGVTGLLPLTELEGVQEVWLQAVPLRLDEVRAVAGITGLRTLSLHPPDLDERDRLDLTALRAAHPGLELRIV